MDISIVIVNYNVKHFLEQCLHSVYNSLNNIESEVFVVDNNSVDGSCQMIKDKFPEVKLIENKDNLGFAKANNQAIRIAKGRYILLLNPDTFVQEDTLKKCVDFCNQHPKAGGLGVKMIDGKGNFLPESKRSLPTPIVAFYKIFGLSSLFPKSKKFGRYHMGYLDKDKNHKIEILAGAFMMLRKEVLDRIGLLDENFFMYGEDIDLSYRIIKAGYDNYYFADTTIIHYKGESTKKGSINYVLVFYKAMIIFAKKHFSVKNARIYTLLIKLAVYLRAAIGITRRIVVSLFNPVLDFLFMYMGFYFLVPYWEKYQFGIMKYYPLVFYKFIVPAYLLIWMFLIYLFGGYEKKIRAAVIFRGVITGSILILLIYALLPESLRFSRALILFGSVWSIVSVFTVRIINSIIFKGETTFDSGKRKKRIATIGSDSESKRVIGILDVSQLNYAYVGRISLVEKEESGDILGNVSQMEEIIRINKIDELVFCSQDIAGSDIIEIMLSVSNATADFKIAPPESVSVIGSNSINTAGDLYVVEINSLSKGVNKRKKRMFDIVSGVTLLLLSPVLMFFMEGIINFYKNLFKVIIGKYTWVGVTFDRHDNIYHTELKKGILNPFDGIKKVDLSLELKQRMNIMYAKDYKVLNDVVILLRSFHLLGKSNKSDGINGENRSCDAPIGRRSNRSDNNTMVG